MQNWAFDLQYWHCEWTFASFTRDFPIYSQASRLISYAEQVAKFALELAETVRNATFDSLGLSLPPLSLSFKLFFFELI